MTVSVAIDAAIGIGGVLVCLADDSGGAYGFCRLMLWNLLPPKGGSYS